MDYHIIFNLCVFLMPTLDENSGSATVYIYIYIYHLDVWNRKEEKGSKMRSDTLCK